MDSGNASMDGHPDPVRRGGRIPYPKSILGWGILLLVIIVAVLAFLNRGAGGLPEGRLQIKAGDIQLGEVTIADLQKLPAVEKKMTIRSSSRGTTDHEFTGAPMLAVLNSIDPGLSGKYTRIVTRGSDGYTSGVEMSEVLQPDNVYVVYADFGKPLKTRTGEDGAMQIIICRDQFGQRFTYFLVSLELE